AFFTIHQRVEVLAFSPRLYGDGLFPRVTDSGRWPYLCCPDEAPMAEVRTRARPRGALMPRPRARTMLRLTVALVLSGAVVPTFAPPVRAGGDPDAGQGRAQYVGSDEYEIRVRESKARQVELMSQGERRRIEKAKRWAAEVRAARRKKLPLPIPGARK